jgi:hypothetical protein
MIVRTDQNVAGCVWVVEGETGATGAGVAGVVARELIICCRE